MSGLWRKREETPEGKYLVQRRDGTIPEWPWFVLGARDPAAHAALFAYAEEARRLEMDPDYVNDIRQMAIEWREDILDREPGDPDAPPHLKDDPDIINKMKQGHSA